MAALIRAARAGDMDAVAAIWNHVIDTSQATFTTTRKDPAALAAALPATPGFLVAEEAGTVLGFATYFQFRGGIGYARTMELSIHLAEDARGRGIGSDLLAALITHAGAHDVGSLWAGISSANRASVAFHERHGFETIATLPAVGHKWDTWLDLILMRRWITGPDPAKSDRGAPMR